MKQWTNVGEPAGDLKRLTTAIGIAIAFFGITLICIIAYAGWSSNRAAVETEVKLLEKAINQSIARVLSEQKSVAWWDDSVKNIEETFNPEWVDLEIGLFLVETYGQDDVYIINGDDKPIYAYERGGRL